MFRRVLAGLLILLAAGCNRADYSDDAAKSSPGNGTKGYRIAVIPKGTTHVFWKSVHAGALNAAKELTASGTPVEVQWKGALLLPRHSVTPDEHTRPSASSTHH